MQARSPRQELMRGGLQMGGGLLLGLVGLAAILLVAWLVARPYLHSGRQSAETLLVATAYAADTVQCRGTTLTGARCKNRTRNPNGYCYHHQGQAPKPKAEPSELPR